MVPEGCRRIAVTPRNPSRIAGALPAKFIESCLTPHDPNYRLRIRGLVENPVELSLDELRALPRHEQITQHFCIQGWSGIAKWGGVSMQTIHELVKPKPEAKWVVFYSLGDGADGGAYYDAQPIDQMH